MNLRELISGSEASKIQISCLLGLRQFVDNFEKRNGDVYVIHRWRLGEITCKMAKRLVVCRAQPGSRQAVLEVRTGCNRIVRS